MTDPAHASREQADLARADTFHALVENSPHVVIRYDSDCRRTYANPALLRLAGQAEPQEFLGKQPTENSPVLSDVPAYEARIRQVLATGEPQDLLVHGQGARGPFWHQTRLIPERDAQGNVTGVLSFGHDVTPLVEMQQASRRASRELRILRDGNRLLGLAEEKRMLAAGFSRVVCDAAGYRMAWVGTLEERGGLRPLAGAGDLDGYAAEARLCNAADSFDRHPASAAVRTGESVVIADLETAPPAPWRDTARACGSRSLMAIPLREPGAAPLGVLVIHSAEPDAFTSDEAPLLEELANQLAFGLSASRNRERREKAERALHESGPTYRTLFLNSPLGLFRMTPEGRLQEVNPACAALFGYDTPEAMVREGTGPGVSLFASPESRTTSIAELLAAPDTTRHETRFRRRDGTGFSANLFLKTVRDAHGSPLFLEGIIEDVTDFKRSQERLRLLQFAVNNVREEAYLITEQGAFQFVNEAAARALGYRQDELLAMTIPDVDPDFTAERFRSHWTELRQRRSMTIESRHRRRDGRVYPVEISANYFEYDGTPYNLALARDISERHQAEIATRRLNRALKTLSSGNEALVRAQSEAELLDRMCRVVVESGAYRFAWIGFARADGSVAPRAWAGEGADWLDLRRRGPDPVPEAVRSGRSSVFHLHEAPGAAAEFSAQMVFHGFHACAAFPLFVGGDAGVLAIYASEADAFDEDEVRLLTEMSEDLTYGLGALRLRAERERSVAHLRASMESTIEALSGTVELRDPYTAGHQRRVARLAKELARRLGWDEERTQAIYLAGMVHDIGKIAIPAEILSKPAALTEAELMLVRGHAEAGFEILKPIDFPWPIARIVHQHHERLDGSGYPLGIAGEAISLEARILAVCDVVEAMSSHRPYRPGFAIEAVLAELRRGRGTQYDATVVDVCIDLLRHPRDPLGEEKAEAEWDLATPLS